MPIQVQELDCQEGAIGLITLDAPQTLNALSEDMLDGIQATLDNWAEDPRINLVVLTGNGDRGFCAGSNIRNLYEALTGGDDPEAPARLLTKEYRLDYNLHCYPKPLVGIGHGIVMGGGLGLLSGCRYRLVTPDLVMAMPEISIGLFPDAGASWFLNRLPGRLGLFLGLTGARLNVSDALRIGLADMAIRIEDRDALLEELQTQRWTGKASADDNRLYRLLNRWQSPNYRALPASELAKSEQTISRLIAGDDLPAIVQRLTSADVDSDWWRTAINNLNTGCPVTAWLVWNQLKRAQQMSLKDIFRMELAMAITCTRRPDLPEGIRARMIDKDQSPRWSFASIADVPMEVVDEHFDYPWGDGPDPMGLD